MPRAAASGSQSGRPRAERRPANERRAEILRTAKRAFAQKGYRDTGTAEIARQIGISEPTLYRYFKSKRDIYLEALELGSSEILASWEKIARDASSPVEALLALGTWYFEDLQRNSSALMLRARAEIETDDPEVRAQLAKNFLDTFAFVRQLHEAAQQEGLLGPNLDLDARTWLFMSLGALVDRTQLLGLRSELQPAEIARVFVSLAPELTVPSPPPSGDRGRDGESE